MKSLIEIDFTKFLNESNIFKDGACGSPFKGGSSCSHKIQCQNRYCICEVKVSCQHLMVYESLFSHEEIEEQLENVITSSDTEFQGILYCTNVIGLNLNLKEIYTSKIEY